MHSCTAIHADTACRSWLLVWLTLSYPYSNPTDYACVRRSTTLHSHRERRRDKKSAYEVHRYPSDAIRLHRFAMVTGESCVCYSVNQRIKFPCLRVCILASRTVVSGAMQKSRNIIGYCDENKPCCIYR